MRVRVDLNCDLGESFGAFKVGHDEEVMPFITSANIACGFHAGDPVVMAHTVKLAQANHVAVGAHPGYPDLMGFGRRNMSLSGDEVRSIVIYQIGALDAFAKAVGSDLQHVKPHGALYNTAASNAVYVRAVIDAVQSVNPSLVLFALANSPMATAAAKAGLRVAHEVFVDRAYNADGSLVSRTAMGAVIEDAEVAAARAVDMVTAREVAAVDGQAVQFDRVDTLCVHGDTLNAVDLAKAVKNALLAADIDVASPGSFL
jgi:UPF0271 protein